MRSDVSHTGRQFLDSLTLYLKWRIEQAKNPRKRPGPEPREHIVVYEAYLKALGAQPKLARPLMRHMKEMKEAGRVVIVPKHDHT